MFKSDEKSRNKLLQLARKKHPFLLCHVYKAYFLNQKKMNALLQIGTTSDKSIKVCDLSYRRLIILGHLIGVNIVDISLIIGVYLVESGKDDELRAEAADPQWIKE